MRLTYDEEIHPRIFSEIPKPAMWNSLEVYLKSLLVSVEAVKLSKVRG